ncbi:MAG: PilZ domain-containing protein [Gammaproteobacteria bacterium]|nr:PilZ domain-containing protein [Gammaproteobacteria bacterium]MCW8922450.1 PilZ domain-containing protein [Gammaproteobacteria bacterium]
MSDQNNRRADTRYTQHEVVSLTIIFTSQNPGLLGKTLKGNTIDVSASGLRIVLGTALPPDSTIDVSIKLKDDPNKFFLSGKVRWCRETVEAGTYQVGVVLQDLINTETDLKRWKKTIK